MFTSVLVGAPKDSYKDYGNSGSLYKCPFSLDSNDCSLVDVDFKPATNSDEC
jgi:hypothetical protein